MPEKILLGSVTHECKAYAMPRWLEAMQRIRPSVDEVLVVDNSPLPEFFERYHRQVPMVRLGVDYDHPNVRIARSMEVLRKRFLAGDFTRWFNLEADVIAPSNAVEVLLHWGRDADWISHAYPARVGDPDREQLQGIGCSMLSRRLVDWISFDDTGTDSPDVWLWDMVRRSHRFRTVELWDCMRLEHLRE